MGQRAIGCLQSKRYTLCIMQVKEKDKINKEAVKKTRVGAY